MFIFAPCIIGNLDPDRLPSIEVLLVPPKRPFPQLRSELDRLKSSREVSELKLSLSVKAAFARARISLLREVDAVLNAEITRLRSAASKSSFIEKERSRNVENLVVNVLPIHDVGLGVKEEVAAVFEKQSREERTQLQQSIKEFDDVQKVLVDAVKSGVKKYLATGKKPKMRAPGSRQPASFVQLNADDGSDFSGIKPVLNLRVGSSSVGDGLGDGSSFPSVVGMIRDDYENSLASENALLNSVLFFSRVLGQDCIRLINQKLIVMRQQVPSSFIDPSAPVANAVKQALKYLPPGVPRLWRKRSFKHSTVQLDIHPPSSDEQIDREMLRAMLKSGETIRSARIKSFTSARKRLLKDMTTQIHDVIRQHAIILGLWSDGDFLPSYNLNDLMFSNETASL